MIMTEKVKFYFFKSNALQDKIDEQIFELYSSFASIRIKKVTCFTSTKLILLLYYGMKEKSADF